MQYLKMYCCNVKCLKVSIVQIFSFACKCIPCNRRYISHHKIRCNAIIYRFFAHVRRILKFLQKYFMHLLLYFFLSILFTRKHICIGIKSFYFYKNTHENMRRLKRKNIDKLTFALLTRL